MFSLLRASQQLNFIFLRKGCMSPYLRWVHKWHINSFHTSKVTPTMRFHSSIRPRATSEKEFESSVLANRQSTHKSRSSSDDLDRLLHHFNSQLHQTKRISEAEFGRILTALNCRNRVTSSQAVLIIHCCGSCIPEMETEKRIKLVEDVWNNLLSLEKDWTLDISHYNALLKVHLENEFKFKPNEILKILEQQRIEPNMVTYQHLINRYCQDGDMENARQTLKVLKQKELPLNKNIFNDLILGYARAKNMEDATKILDEMSAAHLIPGSSTYCALACAYASLGDVEQVLATIKEANTRHAKLQGKEFLSIIYTLTVNNFSHLIQKVLLNAQYKPDNYHEFINLILELINKGHHETGFNLMNLMSAGTERELSNPTNGMFFIRQIVKTGVPPTVVIDYCKKLKESAENTFPLHKATVTALELKKTDEAIIFLKEMHSQGYQLCPHYFWPILIDIKGNEEGIYSMLKLMVDLVCPADYDTFIGYIFPFVDISDPHVVITRLKAMGYEVKDVVEMLCLNFLWNGDIQALLGILEKYPIRVPSSFPRILAAAYLKAKDAPSTAKILKYGQENYVSTLKEGNEKDFSKSFMSELLASKDCDLSVLETLLEALNDKGIKISKPAADLIKSYIGKDGSNNILSVLNNLSISQESSQLSTEPGEHLANMTVSDLAVYLNEHKSKNQVSSEIFHKLLMTYAKHKHLKHVKLIKMELDTLGFAYQAPTYATLMDLFCYHADLDSALYYKEKIDEHFPFFQLRTFHIINLAILLANNKKYNDAEALISKHFEKCGNKENDQKNNYSSIFRLLDSFSNSEDVQHARKLFEMLHDFKYCQAENVLLGPLVKAYILKNNLQGAVDEFLRIVKTYHCTPWLSELMRQLIEVQDSGRLQTVVDAAMKVHGDANVLFNLICAFIESGKLTQAKKVVDTPGLRIKADRVDSICETYLHRNQIEELELFVKITVDVFGLDRDRMYYYLLKAFVNAEDVEGALNVWTTMQEENVRPSSRTLFLLGKFLRQMNQPVPFDIPTDPDTDRRKVAVLKKMLQEEDPDGALIAKESLSLKDGSLTIGDVSQIIKLLLKKKRVRDAVKLSDELFNAGFYPNVGVTRSLAHTLSEIGDRETLLQLQERLPEEIAKIIPFSDYFAFTYINSGKSEEFLNNLENEVFKYKSHFPGGALLALLSREPVFLERVRRLVDIYYLEGNPMPKNIFWVYLLKNHKFEEADVIFKSTSEMQSNLYFNDLLRHIRLNNDVQISQKLVDQTKDTAISEVSKGLIFSSHINVLISTNKTDEALNCFHEAQQRIGLRDFNKSALVRLKLHLSQEGRKVPFNVN